MKKLVIFLLFCLYIGSVLAQPSNDNCLNAISITNLSGGCNQYNNTGATSDIANGSCATGTNNVWFSFVAQGPSATISINNAPNKFKPELSLIYFDPNPCEFVSAYEVACQVGIGQWTTVTLSTSGTLTAGETYYILMTTAAGDVGNYEICVTNPPAPTNDEVCDATTLPVNGSCLSNQTNLGSSSLWYGGCVPAGTNMVWYSFSITGQNNQITVDLTTNTFGGNVNLMLATNNDNCPVNTGMTLVDDYCGNTNSPVLLTGLSTGVTYYLGVGTAVGDEGTFTICGTQSESTGSGNGGDCSSPITLACGQSLIGETTIGNGNAEDSWGCHVDALSLVIPTPGEDRFYAVAWPDATNGGTIRFTFSNVDDANDTYLEFLGLGSTCSLGNCTNSDQLTISTGLFGSNTPSVDYSVPAGVATYYFVVDAQNDGIDTYDIAVDCFTTGIQLDVNNSCGATFDPANPNEGIYTQWNGVFHPVDYNASDGGTVTVCENIYIENVGWEWLKTVDIIPGSCFINVTAFSPNGTNNGQNTSKCGGATTSGSWTAGYDGATISWSYLFDASCGAPEWGDGDDLGNNYTCGLYTFCFTADIDPNCTDPTGLQNLVSATDDGIGGSGGSTSPSNITVSYSLPNTNVCPLANINAGTGTVCAGQDLLVNGNPSGGTGVYVSHSWAENNIFLSDAGIVNPVFNCSVPGTYLLSYTVTDANTCSYTDSIYITVTALPTALDYNAPAYCEDAAGTGFHSGVNLTTFNTNVNGGSGSTVSWYQDGAVSIPVSSETNATVSDGLILFALVYDGSCYDTAYVTFTVNEIPSGIVNIADALCNASCDGIASAVFTGGLSPYTYLWSDGLSQTDASASALCSGTYTVTVTDGNSCSSTSVGTVSEPAQLVGSVTASTNVLCFGGSTGTATVGATGGTSPYQYSWPDASTDVSNAALSSGTHTVTITDDNSCTATINVNITQPSQLSATILSSLEPGCFGSADGSISSGGAGGALPYSFSWSNGATVANINGLTAGNYFLTVTDNNGCQANTSISIDQPAALAVTISATEPSCFNACDGNATASVSGGTIPYSYQWDDALFQDSITAIDLCAGNYNVIVTDNNDCQTTDLITIAQPSQIVITSVVTDATCGNNDGSAIISVTGGTPAYSYTWSNSATADSIFNVASGGYTVTVTDQNNCSQTGSVNISDIGAPSASIVAYTNVSCNGLCDGTAEVNASGGTPPYSYSWSNSGTDSVATGLCAATYFVTVLDANNCKATSNQLISQPPVLNAAITNSYELDCNSDCNGVLTLSINGGTSPYSFVWDSSAGDQTTQTATGLCANTYSVTVTDINGCSDSAAGSVNEPSALTAVFSSSFMVECFGDCDGQLSPTVNGGTPPYSYQWDVSSGSQTSPVAINLCEGQYFVTVTDMNGCTTSSGEFINEPSELSASALVNTEVLCYGLCNGAAASTVSGGTLPYSYQWNDAGNQTTSMATNLCAGNYSLVVTDNFGCTATTSIDLLQPTQVVIDSSSVSDISCFGLCDGIAYASATGGTGTISYLWDDATSSTLQEVTGLCSGDYSVLVSDQNGCSVTQSLTINENEAVQIDSSFITNILINGNCTGGISIYASGGDNNFTYQWSNSGTTASQTNLCDGVYSVTVSDGNNCTFSQSFNITEPEALTASITNKNSINCYGNCNGTATVTPVGGVAPYSYLWNTSPMQIDSTATGLCSGNYTVIVTDENGATASVNVSFISPPLLIASIDTSYDASATTICDGIAIASTAGGVGPMQFSWSNGETNDTASALCGGETHMIIVTDNNGCTDTASVFIGEPTMTASVTNISDASCYSLCDGNIIVTAIDGAEPYSYQWSDINTQTTQLASDLCSGMYSVTITDNTGYSVIVDSIEINEPEEIIANYTVTDILCYNESTGSVSVDNISGGTGGFSILWDDGTTGNLNSGLSAVSGWFQIVDMTGCSITENFQIDQPLSGLSIEIDTIKEISCYGFSDGELNAIVSGGTSPYSYYWDDVNTESSVSGLGKGWHYVTVTDANGCIFVSGAYLYQPVAFLLDTIYTLEVSCTGNNDGMALVGAKGGTRPYNYEWLTDPPTQDSIAENLEAGKYVYVIKDGNGCLLSDTVAISSISTECIEIPTAISPNNDGDNDTWKIRNIHLINEVFIEVYNRWGNKVFEYSGSGTDYSETGNQWDGTSKGKELPSGAYVFIVDLKDGNEPIKGIVTIFR